ncbi:MAG: SAM-dependent methyltransferase [Paracoccaceae bacterium]|nr:SAM-dependent methyltransferase [Paracoccaceae bacterium]
MTPLAEALLRRIEAAGPITMAEYMATCLTDPTHGYYATRDPLGAAGDFTTAPEISQMFGELLGLALAQAWLDRGAPAPFRLLELGPGRGTLMADLLRATKAVPGFHDALRLGFVEVSPVLRDRQKKAVAPVAPVWFSGLMELDGEDLPVFAVANEYFDALPVRQFVRGNTGWSERMVGRGEDGALALGLGPETPRADLANRLDDTRAGDIVEASAAAEADAGLLGQWIAERGGLALIVDYGDWRSLGDTLQALRGHIPEPILQSPGVADLTAHVDFEALAEAASPALTTRLTPQGVFLERLGITARTKALAAGLEGAALDSHIAAHRRLTHPGEMGTLFKAMALYRAGDPPPPGFET